MLRATLFILSATILFVPISFASCDKDIDNYCTDVYENGGNVLACLHANKSQLGSSCLEDLDSINETFNVMMKNCGEALEKYCYKPTSRNPKPFPECLTENATGGNQNCWRKVHAYESSMESVLGGFKKRPIASRTPPPSLFKYNSKNCLSLLAVLPIMTNAEVRRYVTDSQKLYQPVDLTKMIDKIETLAKAGVGDASYTMAALLQAGSNYCVPRDEKMSMRYYKKAAEQGNERAKRMMKSIGE